MELFASNQPFFKGNLHAHTTRSDGALSPEQVTALYRDAGYDFLALTDHRLVGNRPYWDGGLLVLPGIELDYELTHEVVHIIGVGLDEPVVLRHDPSLPPQSGVDYIRARGGRAILAHPAWSLNTLQTMASLRGLIAAEVFNSVSGPPLNAIRQDSSSLLDVAAANGTVLPLVAADDSHGYTGEQFGGFTMVQAAELTPAALLAALDKGRFYASQGPLLEQIDVERGALTVHCSPVSRIIFYSNLPWVSNRCREGHELTEARYEAQPGESFVRAQLIDAQGRSCWTSPIRL